MREFTEEHRKKIGEARRKWLAEHPEEKGDREYPGYDCMDDAAQ